MSIGSLRVAGAIIMQKPLKMDTHTHRDTKRIITMQQVTDTNGNKWNVYRILYGMDHDHVQMNLGKNCAEIGLTLPSWMVQSWLAGEIRVKVCTN